MEDGGIERFPEPYHMGSHEGTAFFAMRGDFIERDIMIFNDGVLLDTPVLPDVSVELYDILRTGPLMESVDVLCDQREIWEKFFPACKDLVTRVGIFGGDDPSSPVIPFPDQFGILEECRGCGELFGSVIFPQAIFSPECWDARFRRNTGSRKQTNTFCSQ